MDVEPLMIGDLARLPVALAIVVLGAPRVHKYAPRVWDWFIT